MSEDLTSLAERVNEAYKEPLAEFLRLSAANQAWLESLPLSQQWMLSFSEFDAWKALAKSQEIPFRGNREAPAPPAKGEEFVELAQRRHTTADAMQTGELVWGSGGIHVKGTDPTSIPDIIKAMQAANLRLVETLISTLPNRQIVQKNSKTGEVQRTLTALDALKELNMHEQNHADLGRIMLDGANSVFPASYTRTMPQTPRTR